MSYAYKGYTGISFPFRIGSRGGVALSSTDRYAIPHIEESIIQILRTNTLERVMEPEFGCNLDLQIFEPQDIASQNMIKYEIVEALTKHEPRIQIGMDDVTIESTSDGKLYVNLEYLVISYNIRMSTKVDLGGDM